MRSIRAALLERQTPPGADQQADELVAVLCSRSEAEILDLVESLLTGPRQFALTSLAPSVARRPRPGFCSRATAAALTVALAGMPAPAAMAGGVAPKIKLPAVSGGESAGDDDIPEGAPAPEDQPETPPPPAPPDPVIPAPLSTPEPTQPVAPDPPAPVPATPTATAQTPEVTAAPDATAKPESAAMPTPAEITDALPTATPGADAPAHATPPPESIANTDVTAVTGSETPGAPIAIAAPPLVAATMPAKPGGPLTAKEPRTRSPRAPYRTTAAQPAASGPTVLRVVRRSAFRVTVPAGTTRVRLVGFSDMREYTTIPGDSLWVIARREVGESASDGRVARLMRALWERNKNRIGTGNPNELPAGIEIILLNERTS